MSYKNRSQTFTLNFLGFFISNLLHIITQLMGIKLLNYRFVGLVALV